MSLSEFSGTLWVMNGGINSHPAKANASERSSLAADVRLIAPSAATIGDKLIALSPPVRQSAPMLIDIYGALRDASRHDGLAKA